MRGVYAPVSADRTDEEIDETPLQPSRSYFRLWLSDMLLGSSEAAKRMGLPAVYAEVKLRFSGKRVVNFSRVFQPPVDQLGADVRLCHPLTEILPYQGGTIEIDVALYAFQGTEEFATTLDLLEAFSNMVEPPLAQTLAIAEGVSTGFRTLLSASKAGAHLGLHQTFSMRSESGGEVLRPGFVAVVRATTRQVPTERLHVRGGRLYIAANGDRELELLTGYDHVLFQIEGRQERKDWEQLTDIAGPLQTAIKAFEQGKQVLGGAYRTIALAAAWQSADLTATDRRRVVQAIKDELRDVEAGGLGAGGARIRTLGEVIRDRAMLESHAAALGPLSPGEVFQETGDWEYLPPISNEGTLSREPERMIIGEEPQDAPRWDRATDEKVEEPSKPRRLVARVWDGKTMVKSILPPQRALNLAIRVAIPERGDVAADETGPALPAGPGPTVELEVVVRGDVWEQQPASRKISISREKLSQPSTWAVFEFTTPDDGDVVSIEILLLYQGKPLQAATYVSPVRAFAVPGERPTLRTFTLSGPNEPSEELQPVDVTLDGRGAELKRFNGSTAKVLITEVQEMLDTIEDRISRVLGVPGAPDSFNDERALELLISLARIGVELGTSLTPLDLGDARSINVMVNPTTRVLPLELVYAGPAPEKSARLCPHVAELPSSRRLEPPRAGQACTKASPRRVCPYAFWGLHRSIARTVQSVPTRGRKRTPPSPTLSASSVLYAATVIADDGAIMPLPSASVFEAAKQAFNPATRVTNWTAWRRVVKSGKPNLLVVLGHTMVEGGETNLYIGKNSAIARARITDALLRAERSPPPLVLLIACATAALGDPFGSLPGTMTAKGAGAVVGTLSKIIGPHGAAATTHLLQTVHDLAGTDASVGDAVAAARRSLVAERRPIGLILVSHGELDTKLVP